MHASSSSLSGLVDELLMLLKETCDYQQHDEVRAVLREATTKVSSFRRRLHPLHNRYVVAVVGLTNVGKSTLLNAILGDDIAPRRNGPCTAAPIEFCQGNRLRVIAYYHQSLSRPTWNCHDLHAVHSRLSDLADDEGAQASRRIRRVEVLLSHPLLAEGLVIADTPGFGAAQFGDAQHSHEDALKRYLNEDVSQVFWVVLADQGIGRREMLFHDEFFAEVCDDVVVTGCEEWSEQDRGRFRHRFSDAFGNRLPRFHFVSGLLGLKARRGMDSLGLEAAGITLLESRIRELAKPDGRTTSVRLGLTELADDLSYWLREFRNSRGQALAVRWRPDSWGRWKSAPSANGLRDHLTAALES